MNVPTQRVMRRAHEIYAAQPHAPVSPGDIDDRGRVSFCAAAAIAAAGIEIFEGPAERQRFATSITESRSSEELFAVFERFGWDAHFCAATVGVNDLTPNHERRRCILNFLSGTASLPQFDKSN